MYNMVTKQSSLEELKKALEEVNTRMEELEQAEPADAESEAYEKWEADCGELAVMSETLMTWIDEKMTEGL